jgi:hypothetical protein
MVLRIPDPDELLLMVIPAPSRSEWYVLLPASCPSVVLPFSSVTGHMILLCSGKAELDHFNHVLSVSN